MPGNDAGDRSVLPIMEIIPVTEFRIVEQLHHLLLRQRREQQPVSDLVIPIRGVEQHFELAVAHHRKIARICQIPFETVQRCQLEPFPNAPEKRMPAPGQRRRFPGKNQPGRGIVTEQQKFFLAKLRRRPRDTGGQCLRMKDRAHLAVAIPFAGGPMNRLIAVITLLDPGKTFDVKKKKRITVKCPAVSVKDRFERKFSGIKLKRPEKIRQTRLRKKIIELQLWNRLFHESGHGVPFQIPVKRAQLIPRFGYFPGDVGIQLFNHTAEPADGGNAFQQYEQQPDQAEASEPAPVFHRNRPPVTQPIP